MHARVTSQELEDAMAAAIDSEGNDTRLANAVAEMDPELRRESEENLRRSLADARASLRPSDPSGL